MTHETRSRPATPRKHKPETAARNNESAKRHYAENKEALRARHKAYVEANAQRMYDYKLTLECMDCPPGTKHMPFQLDFDHRPGVDKKKNLSTLVRSAGWNTIMDELAKCDVVCANCHRARTWNQQQHRGHPDRAIWTP